MRILNFKDDPQLKAAMGFFRKVNSSIKEVHGINFDMDAPKSSDATMKFNQKGHPFDGREIRLNAEVPSEELFSLAQELTKSADEPFAARKVFGVDTSFHPGSQTVGFDVMAEGGEAKLVASGRTTPTVPKADIAIGRNLSHVGKIMTSMEVTRDAVQQMDLRGARNLGRFVDLMQEKLMTGRKHIDRAEDQIAWLGGDIEGATGGEIQGLFNRLSVAPADYDSKSPTHGRKDVDTNFWNGDRAIIIPQIVAGVEHITRTNAYFPDTLVLPPSILFGELSFTQTSDTNATPLIKWIKEAFFGAFGKELKVVSSSAMQARDVAGTQRGNAELANDAFLLFDSNKSYQSLAVVEDKVLLPAVTDEQGTIRQVLQMKTGGLQVKHPGAMYLKDGIKAKA